MVDRWSKKYNLEAPSAAKLQSRQYLVFKLYDHVQKQHESLAIFLSGGYRNTRVVVTAPMSHGKDKIRAAIFGNDVPLEMYTLSLYAVALDPHEANEAARVKRLCSKAIHWANSFPEKPP